MNNVRHKTCEIFKSKNKTTNNKLNKAGIITDKLLGLYRGKEYEKDGYQPKINLITDEIGNLFAYLKC
jgi:hypothetical protein